VAFQEDGLNVVCIGDQEPLFTVGGTSPSPGPPEGRVPFPKSQRGDSTKRACLVLTDVRRDPQARDENTFSGLISGVIHARTRRGVVDPADKGLMDWNGSGLAKVIPRSEVRRLRVHNGDEFFAGAGYLTVVWRSKDK
jgi:hypothetical protein